MQKTDNTDDQKPDAVADSEAPPEPTLAGPVNIRSTSLAVLAVLASVFFIDWAQAVLLPLVVAVLLSYALDPLVSVFDRVYIPRPISAALVLISLLALIVFASVPLQTEALALLDKIPKALDQFQHDAAFSSQAEESMMEKAQEVAKEIERTADNQGGESEDPPPGVTPVRIVEEPVDIREYLLSGSSAALVLFSQFFSVLLLVYFMLAVGNLYKRKMVSIAGPSFQRMRKTVQILDEFHLQVRRFLFVTLLSCLFVGFFTWLAFVLLDVEQAALWGVVAGVASAIPYLGPFLVMIGTGAAAFVQFGTLDMVIVVAGTSLLVTSIQGYLLTPWLTSQMSSLNAVAIFIGLLFWGWIWGPVGLIIATPLLMIVKSLCDHVANLQPVGDLLGK